MKSFTLTCLAILTAGCIADPTDWPYKPAADGDVGLEGDTTSADADTLPDASADVGDDASADASADANADVGGDVDDVSVMEVGGDAAVADAMPPIPELFDCADPQTSCEPITCDGACDVECRTKDATCSVVCDTTERCRLGCSGNVTSCAMLSCDDPTPCGRGWVCNGEC